MSFTDKLILWLHIGFAIFTIGPVTVAIMSTPRYIRKRNLVIVRYLFRTTMIFVIMCLGVLIFGAVLAQLKHDFGKPWLVVSLTLFVVAFALLLLILRDQHRAINALEDAKATAAENAAQAAVSPEAAVPNPEAAPGGPDDTAAPVLGDSPVTAGAHLAHVERGRIASMGGVVSLIWLVILVFMVWNG
jgi:Ca2+/Na+ antiporter